MSRVVPLACLATWTGSTLVLSRMRCVSRPLLRDRVGAFVSPGDPPAVSAHRSTTEAAIELFGRPAREIGERLAAVLGVTEPLSVRLERVHSSADPTAFRLRQLGTSVAVLALATVATVALGFPAPIALAAIGTSPAITFLSFEQRAASTSARWQHRLRLEMPIVAEQIAMLIGAGWSVGAALNRIAERGRGATAADLTRVARRLRHGLSESEALTEWADLARVDAVERLVRVLDRHDDTADLGPMIAAEARSVRRDLQRERIETIERRGQQVWIPVTVAALVPGAMFLAVPFVDALRLFGAA